MSSQVNKLFRHSWLMTFTGIGGLMLVLMAFSLLQLIGQDQVEPWMRFDGVRWMRGMGQSFLLALMASATLPWLLLSFSGEWLYTRSLNRQQLFEQIWQEYLKWSALPCALLLALTSWTQLVPYDSGSQIPWEQVGFSIGINLLIALIFASNARIFKSLILPVFLMSLGLYLANSWGLDKTLIWAGISISGICLILYAYQQVAHDRRDLNVSRLGTEDDENQSLERLKIFQGFERFSKLRLSSLTGLSALWGRMKLVTEHSRMIYLQVLLIVLTFSLALILLQLPTQFLLVKLFPRPHLFDDLGCSPCFQHHPFLLSAALFGGLAFLLLLIPSRLLINDRWEFLATRPQAKQRIYLANWGLQSALVIFLALLSYGSLLMQPELAPYLNLEAILWLGALLLIGGELFAFLMIVLLTISVSLTPDLLIAWLTVLHGHDWPAWAFGALAIAFRLWDSYKQAAISADSKASGQAMRNAVWHYGPILTLALILTGIAVESQPLARFIARPALSGMSDRSGQLLAQQSLLAIYTHLPNQIREKGELKASLQIEEIRNLINQPYHSDYAFAFSKSFLMRNQWWKQSYHGEGYVLPQKNQSLEKNDSLRAADYWLKQDESQDLERSLELKLMTDEQLGNYASINELPTHRLNSNNPKNELLKARIDSILFRKEQALKRYLELAQQHPEAASQAYLQAGKLANQSKLYAQASDYWLKHLKLNKDKQIPSQKVTNFDELEPVLQELLLFPFYEHQLCAEQAEFRKLITLDHLPSDSLKRLDTEQALCLGQPNRLKPSIALANWYKTNQQPDKAIETYLFLKVGSRAAQLLLAQGKLTEAKALAKKEAQAWRKNTYAAVYISNLRTNRQYLSHRILLQTLQPGESASWDSGLHVLMGSLDSKADEILIEKAFKSQPELLQKLKGIAKNLNTVYQHYELNGFLNAQNLRSPERTLVMLSIADVFQASKAVEFREAVKELKRLLL